MRIRDDVLLDAIETSLFLIRSVPGVFDDLSVPGVIGRMTPVSHPLANLVGAARLASDTVDATIGEIYDLYAEEQKAFGWIVGPGTTPPDLPERLTRRGVVKVDEMAGMVLTDMSISIESNPAVRIREVGSDDFVAASRMMARAYGLPDDVADLMTHALCSPVAASVMRNYLAYVGDNDEPVAFSSLGFIPGESIVLLGGAATLTEHRGHGVYTSLVARRLADAREAGADAAVIQAVRSTSAPICAKLGFQEVCGLDFYAWIPPDGAAHV